MTLGTLLLAFGLTTASPPSDSLVSADSAIALLRKGGFTVMWRHAQTDRSVSDIPGETTERFQQRNLNDIGIATAKSVGLIFKARAIPVGDVIASPMFRTLETAQYAFGRATTTVLLRTLDPSDGERQLILAPPAPGTNRVLVTHHFIIERNVPGIKPGDVGEGEAAIVRSDGTTLKTVAVIKLADWKRLAPDPAELNPSMQSLPAPQFALAGVSQETAAMLHSGRGHVALSYVQSFNAGRDAMKAFFESYAVADPARSLDQRLDAWEQLRKDLGGLAAITGVEVVAPDEMAITARMTTGKQVTISFRQQAAAPYKAVAISFRMPHGG
ncbi:MAG TPA: histidine phosphatase family protein [Gemmatimonadaceae bacterium]|nr:histidine phosphatase family protein [Gemmatimonadaceae bacterium]